MPHSSGNDPLEDGLATGQASDTGADDGSMLTDKDWVRMFRDSLKAASDFQQTKLRAPWSRNYRAFANRHMSGSKYDTAKYRHRSKLFKPKTRMAVRKNDATAAAALFSTADVVSITPERASDRLQMMTARFIHAVLNYRLDRTNRMAGPNWFLTALGARQDTQLTGICVSKQYWEYEEREYEVAIDEPVLDVNGMPVIDPLTGEGTTEEKTETRTEKVRDRIMITVIEPEHAFIDQTADWRDPIQEGGYFIAGYPMRKEDLETIIAQNSARPMMGGGAWRSDIDIAKITQAGSGEMRRSEGVRRARDDGTDRYESRHADKNGEVIWLYECFYRYDGEDWHYWMLGETILLSDPRPTRDSYPEQKGDRPYVMGVGALESHKTHPTAPVETWQPLQQELNDITNLGLDARKMAISPITKIRRGRNIDWKQVQNRGPDAMIMVEEIDDVSFDRAPSPDGSAQVELNTLNVDFDELAGVFSTGSVQSNRQLNETVGGMNLMASSSNALTEYDLRVWVETWVEPCLRQCVRAIQHYESDEIVMAVAGEKAGLLQGSPSQKPSPLDGPPQGEQGEEQISFQDVMNVLGDAQVSVKVNVGIGALDSRQKLEKFMGGVKMTMEMGPLLAASGIKPNGAAMAQEAWGLLGYKDADRFFERMPEDKDKQPPPEVQKQMLDMKAKGEEAERKRLADEQSMTYEREKHQWAQEDRAREQMTRQQDEAVKHQQGVDTMTAEAESQRVAAGLPSNEAWTMLAQEMSQSREDNQQMMMAMIREFSTGQQMVAQAIQQMAIAQSAPKTVVTPDGRTFTATSSPV